MICSPTQPSLHCVLTFSLMPHLPHDRLDWIATPQQGMRKEAASVVVVAAAAAAHACT